MATSKAQDPYLAGKDAELKLAAKDAEIYDAAENKNTQRAFDNAIKHFTEVYGESLPCTELILKNYLVEFAGKLSIATLEQRRVMIARWHKDNGFEHNPNDSELVRKYMKGIRIKYGCAPKKAKPAPLNLIKKVVIHLDSIIANRDDDNHRHRLRSVRDKALILTAFWFGLRSDELINLRKCDVTFFWDSDEPYFELFFPKTKTDTAGKGSEKQLKAMLELCPMHAVRDWLEVSSDGVDVKKDRNSKDPLFSKISRWGVISDTHIHPNSINKMFSRLIDDTGVNSEEYSSHSMRRGIANWIVDSGASVAELQVWIGWSDPRTAMRYLDGKNSLPSELMERMQKEKILNEIVQGKLENDSK